MPDRATILAATPKCPAKLATSACDAPLRFDAHCECWRCPVHGAVLTSARLVGRLLASA